MQLTPFPDLEIQRATSMMNVSLYLCNHAWHEKIKESIIDFISELAIPNDNLTSQQSIINEWSIQKVLEEEHENNNSLYDINDEDVMELADECFYILATRKHATLTNITDYYGYAEVNLAAHADQQLKGLYVAKAMQGKAIGTLLMSAACAMLYKRNIFQMNFTSEKQARGYYNKIGALPIQRHNFRIPTLAWHQLLYQALSRYTLVY